VEHIIQELAALTHARRDWRGYPHYQEAIQPLEEQVQQEVTALGLPLDVRWDFETKVYGLFPRDILFPGNSKEGK